MKIYDGHGRPVTLFILKHLRDLRSGKPETDVWLFASEEAAREFKDDNFLSFVPREWTKEEGLVCRWSFNDGDEFLELERIDGYACP